VRHIVRSSRVSTTLNGMALQATGTERDILFILRFLLQLIQNSVLAALMIYPFAAILPIVRYVFDFRNGSKIAPTGWPSNAIALMLTAIGMCGIFHLLSVLFKGARFYGQVYSTICWLILSLLAENTRNSRILSTPGDAILVQQMRRDLEYISNYASFGVVVACLWALCCQTQA